MKRHIHLLLIVALCSCLSELMAANVAPRPLSTTYHVSPTGQESNDGLSWAQALATITNAVARAGTGDRVVVSNGTYVVPATGSATTPWIVIDKGITVESVEGPDATILDGASAAYRRGVSISHADAVFSGFTIRNIRSSISSMGQGGALQITAGTVTNCVIRNYWGSWSGAIGMTGGLLIDSRVLDNKSDDSLSQAGGIHLLSGSPQVIGCEISGNHAKLGAGVYLNVAGARLSRSVIHGNVNDPTGRGASGAIHLINGLVEQCVITNNTGLRGGGVQLLGGSVRNCLIARNRDLGATGGGGVHQAGGTLDACTIALNTCLGRGNGLHQTGGSCINTIVAHNGLLGLFRDIDNLHRTGGTFTFNCAYPPQAGNGNLAAAPGFVDLAGGNLRLAPATPCRNAGSNSAWMTGATDLDGQPRLVETTVDLGVFEAVPTNTLPFACDIVATPTDGLAPFEVTLEARIFNAPAAVSACNWDFGDSTAGSGATVTNTYDTGCFTVTLTVVTPAGNASRTITNLVCGGTSRAYVATDGTHVWPFETPLKAATNIQTALDVLLLPDADTRGVVTVAPGTYAHRNAVSTIQVTRKILLKSDSGPVQTILDGALRGLVLNVNHPDALVAGFGITRGITTEIGGFSLYAGTLTNCVVFNNGNAYYAGGVLNNGTITHCAFTQNKTADGGHGGGGRGGLLMINGTLQHSWITNNTDVTCVGGLEVRGGSVRDCLIANNIQTRNGNNYGGGLYLNGANALVERCIITNNRALATSYTGGGGVWIRSGTLRNSLVAGNSALFQGGGLYQFGGTVESVTVTANHSGGSPEHSSGLFLAGGTLRNTIAYGNAGTNTWPAGGAAVHTCSYPLLPGTGNLDADPRFSRPASGNYRLATSSPCIDAGLNQAWMDVTATDLDGAPRIYPNRKATVDLGAYEGLPPSGAMLLLR